MKKIDKILNVMPARLCRKKLHLYTSLKCVECYKAQRSAYTTKNKDKIRLYMNNYIAKNKEREASRKQRYAAQHKSKLQDARKNYIRQRKKTDVVFVMQAALRSRLVSYLKKMNFNKTSSVWNSVGLSPAELRSHLVATAIKTYGKYYPRRKYHIDHIIPLSSAKTVEEAYALNHFTNLQYLFPLDNMRKGARHG